VAKPTKTKEIKITCKGSKYLPIDDLKNFQGNLKELRKDELKKLKRSILKHGFSFPVFVWKTWIMDGHQRIFTVKELFKEGHTIGDIPVVDIEAGSKKEAAEKLLLLNSRYAKITDDGFYEYLNEFDLDLLEFKDDLELPEINLDRFIDGYLGGGEDDYGGENETIEEAYQILVECDGEEQQLELLTRFETEGVKCRALIS